MANILILSCHAVLEADEYQMFTDLGHDVFSHGAYIEPEGHYLLPRGEIKGAKTHPELAKLARMFPKTDLPLEMINWADIVIIMHTPEWISGNWKKFRELKKRVIWRSIGQSTPRIEQIVRFYKQEGLEIIRYSPKEQNIKNYAGQNELIRFYKDPDEFTGWNGQNRDVINMTQSLKGRRVFCHYDEITNIISNFHGKVYGSGNDDLGELNGGELPFDLLKKKLQDSRAFIYGGTYPASYTLSFIEAWMCFPGDTIVGSPEKIEDVLERDYKGEMLTIETEMGNISCTPNHPFLTQRGFVKAEELCIMDSIYQYQDTKDEKQSLERRRIEDIVKEFESSKQRDNETTTRKNSLVDIRENSKGWTEKNKLSYFYSAPIFYDALRDLILSWNNRRGGNSVVQGKQKEQKNSSNNANSEYGQKIDRLDNKPTGDKKSGSIGEKFTITKKSIQFLVEGLENVTLTRGIKSLSLDQKRAMWNFDWFYQESGESELQKKLLSIRNRLLNKDKNVKSSRVKKITRKPFSGKVYNLSTADGIYLADNFIVHNTGIPVIALGQDKAENISGVEGIKFYEIHELIDNEVNGFVSDDLEYLKDKVKLLIQDHALASQIGQAGREKAIKIYGKQSIYNQWKAYL